MEKRRKTCGCMGLKNLLKKFKKKLFYVLTNYISQYIISIVQQGWRNWQTRTVQVRVVAIP